MRSNSGLVSMRSLGVHRATNCHCNGLRVKCPTCLGKLSPTHYSSRIPANRKTQTIPRAGFDSNLTPSSSMPASQGPACNPHKCARLRKLLRTPAAGRAREVVRKARALRSSRVWHAIATLEATSPIPGLASVAVGVDAAGLGADFDYTRRVSNCGKE